MTMESKPTVWASMGATINLGNFQSEKIDIGIAGIPIGITRAELDELLVGGKATLEVVIEKVAEEIGEKIQALGGFRY